MKRGFLLTLTLTLLACWLGPAPARADIVKRELYTNSKGEKVSGYVFQADRRYTRPGRLSYYVPSYGRPWYRVHPGWCRSTVVVRKGR